MISFLSFILISALARNLPFKTLIKLNSSNLLSWGNNDPSLLLNKRSHIGKVYLDNYDIIHQIIFFHEINTLSFSGKKVT